MPRDTRPSNAKCYMVTHQGPWPWHPLTELPEKIAFVVYQLEAAPTTGQQHMQMFLQFEKAGRHMNYIQQVFGNCHAETMKKNSSPQACFDYCTKEDTRVEGPWQLGEMTIQGQRNDLLAVRDALKSGRSDAYIAEHHFSVAIKYAHHLPRLRALLEPIPPPLFSPGDFTRPLERLDTALVLYGATGIGKTEYALAHFTRPLLVTHLDALARLSPDHDGIVFDDLDFSHLHFSAVLNLLDLAQDRDVHIRYTTARLPRGLRRIFTHNTGRIFDIPNLPESQQAAIDRRVRYVDLGDADLRVFDLSE